MKFCTTCGTALEFFEFLDSELCTSCLNGKKTGNTVQAGKPKPQIKTNGLSSAILCREDNKLVLKSPEGWILWSSPDNEKNNLQTIMSRAQRILEIRQKRKNK